jgi:hypothetical protein
VDGVTVLEGGPRAHPARADQVMIGGNRIGASTAQVEFTGKMVEQGRLGAPLAP